MSAPNTVEPDTNQFSSDHRAWDPGGPNEYVMSRIAAVIAATDDHKVHNDDHQSRTELDSHANMPVVGQHALILGDTGRHVDVSPFSPSYEPTTARIVDAAVRYECPFSGQEFLFLVLNAIYIPAMKNNLLPPFIMREAGIIVRDTPKIQLTNPTEMDHAITFPDGFRIPLSLWGIFSFFPTSKPTENEADDIEDVYTLTPARINPHSDVYARNEEHMLDWEGNMVDPKHRTKILLETVSDDTAMIQSLQVSSAEAALIDSVFQEEATCSCSDCREPSDLKGRDSDEVPDDVRPDDTTMAEALQARTDISKFCTSIGATVAAKPSNFFLEDDPHDTVGEIADGDDMDDVE